WGVLQVVTGPLSDRVGRKELIAWGMIVQSGGIWLTVLVPTYVAWLVGAALQGLGTAMVYPTLLAAITDHAHPAWRATSLGVYRFWRDLGYAIGALLSGAVADMVGIAAAIHRGSTRSLNSFRTLSIGSFLSAVAVHSYGSSCASNLPPVLSGFGLAVVLASRSSSARQVSQLPLPQERTLDESGQSTLGGGSDR